jgi:hypothetical protein
MITANQSAKLQVANGCKEIRDTAASMRSLICLRRRHTEKLAHIMELADELFAEMIDNAPTQTDPTDSDEAIGG